MYSKKKRSSILKKCSEEDTTLEMTLKVKRRISFSGKKSVRVYSGEEETKAWNNSYEESDNAVNASAETARNSAGASMYQKQQSLSKDALEEYEIDAGNINSKSNVEHPVLKVLEADTSNENITFQKNCSFNDVSISAVGQNIQMQSSFLKKTMKSSFAFLHTTRDFINNTHHADNLHIENSVDISLYDRESLRPSISFSLIESDNRDKAFGKTCKDLIDRQSLVMSTDPKPKKSKLELPVNEDLQAVNQPMQMKRKTNQSTVSTKIKETGSKNKHLAPHNVTTFNKEQELCKTNNICELGPLSPNENNIDACSLIGPKGDKENIPPHNADFTLENAIGITKIASPIPKGYNLQELAKVTEATELNDRSNLFPLQGESDNSGFSDRGVRVSSQPIVQQEDKHAGSMEISVQNQQLEQSIPQNLVENESTDFQQDDDFEGCQQILDLDFDISSYSKEKQCKTIIFGEKELSESVIADSSQIQNQVASNNGNTVLIGPNEAYSKLNGTTGSGNAKDLCKHKEQQSQCLYESDQKVGVPKFVVVRKNCTPKQSQETVKKMELKRFQRYHNEDEKVNKLDHESSFYRNKNELINFTSVDTESHLNISSPLLSPQYGSKSNFNFRQLNDEIEHGKIKPFPTTKVLLSKPNNKSQKRRDLIGTKETQYVSDKKGAISFETGIGSDLQFAGNRDADMQLEDTMFVINKDIKILPMDNFRNTDQIQLKPNSPEKVEIENLNIKSEILTQNSTSDIDRGSPKGAKFRRTIYYKNDIDMDVDSPVMTNKTKVEQINEQFDCRLREETISGVGFRNMTLKNGDKNIATQMTKNRTQMYKCKNVPETTVENDFPSADYKKEQVFLCSNGMNLDRDSSRSPSKIQLKSPDLKSENGLQVNCKVIAEGAVSNSKRKTVYYIKDNEIDLDNSIQVDAVDVHTNSNDIKISEERQKSEVSKGSRKTLHFIKANDMKLDYSLLSDTISKYEQSEPLNIAKQSLHAQSPFVSDKKDDTFSLQLNKVRASISRGNKNIMNNNEIVDISGSSRKEAGRICRLFEGTPHRSVIEFEHLEIEAGRDPDSCVERETLEPDLDKTSQKLNITNSFKYINRNEMTQSSLQSSDNFEILDAENDIQHKMIFDSNEESNSSCPVSTKCSVQRKLTLYDTVDIGIDESGLKSLPYVEELSIQEISNKEEPRTISLLTPVVNVNSKGTALSLTPIQPVAKKRLTHLFNSCVGRSSTMKKCEVNCESVNNIENVTLDQTNVNLSFAEGTETQEMHGNFALRGRCEKYKTAVLSSRFMEDHASFVGQNAEKALTPISSCELHTNQTVENDVIIKTGSPVQYQNIELNCITEDYERLPVRPYVSHNTESVLKDNSSEPRNLGGKNELTLNESLEPIAIPRRASKRKQEQLKLSLFNLNQCEKRFDNLCKSQIKATEDPITISDVSERQNNVSECSPYKKPHPIELCEDAVVNNIAKLKQSYEDLAFDSRLSWDNIEKTRLSLVETLPDEDDEDVLYVETEPKDANEQPKDCISQLQPQEVAATLSNVSAMCRKCKRCQEALLNGSTLNVAGSFDLPKIPSISNLGMDRLNLIRSKPTISEVNEYWRRKSLEKSYHLDDVKFEMDICPDQEESNYDEGDNLFSELKNRIKRTEIDIATKRSKETNISRKSFSQRLEIKLSSSLANWIFDDQMEARNVFLFTHRRIVTCSILLTFLRTDNLGRDIEIKAIELQSNRFLNKNWKPFHYVLDFQLRLELPYDFHSLCRGNDEDAVFAMLKEIDRLCLDVEHFGRCFWKLICKEKATLIREGKSIYVQKVVRKLLGPAEGECCPIQETVFTIELTNIRKISFKDITEPPLHLLRENIQDLPIGLDFLGVFLKDPMCYLKTNV